MLNRLNVLRHFVWIKSFTMKVSHTVEIYQRDLDENLAVTLTTLKIA